MHSNLPHPCSAALVLLALTATVAHAQAAPPSPHDDAAFDVMNLLAERGLHRIDEERWNLYGQFTSISSWKTGFEAPYTNLNGSINSLVTDPERSFTTSFTLFVGLKLWPGGELYYVPEVIAERPLSQLRGIGGSIQNFELQKGGTEAPQVYRSRLYLKHTVGLGGAKVARSSDPMQLGSTVDRRRLVFTAGNFTVLDTFDRNGVSGDPRQTFFNMAFMTYSSWDFPSDARGYSWGGLAELYWDDWVVRVGRITPPLHPNQLQVDFHIWEHYGDQLELEHDHELGGHRGAVRLLAYRNQTIGGRFDEAVAAFAADPSHNATTCPGFNYGSGNAQAPDLCWVRRVNEKYGVGLSVEQQLGHDVGVFFRGMVSDGQTEVGAYNPADRSASLGALAHGTSWGRDFDLAGAGVGASWISAQHAAYLAQGGVDGFVGDGALRAAPEVIVEAFYSVNFWKAVWLAADYQHLWNPGFNADRGHMHIIGAKVHAEF